MDEKVFYEKGKKYNCYSHGKPYFRKTATINGKRHFFYGDGEKDADRKIEEAKRLSLQGLNYDNKDSKVGAVFSYWLFNVKRVDKNIKESSFARYECAVRNHVLPYPIAECKLSKLDSATMQAYISALYEEYGCSGPSIANTFKVWKMFASWAVDEGFCAKNPCRNISLPGKREKAKKKIETFSLEERKALLLYIEESKYQYDTIIKLAFATGMRQGELLGLRWEDVGKDSINVARSTAVVTHIDKEGNRDRYREVWDTKTENSERVMPILPETAAMLQEHRAKQAQYFLKNRIISKGYVFTTDTGELIDATSFAKSYKRLLSRAGIPYRKFHTIRHTFATEAIRSGVDVKDLQMLMGHADIQTTYIYVQPNDESKRNAIEKLGKLL